MNHVDSGFVQLLKSWGLSQEVIQRFIDEDVDMVALPHLTTPAIEYLIPRIGTRIKFQLKLDEYKLAQEKLPKEVAPAQNASGIIIKSEDPNEYHVPVSLTAQNIFEPAQYPQTTTAEIPQPVDAVPGPSHEAKRMRLQDYDLEAVLNASSKGKVVLASYKQKGLLDDNLRTQLADVIVSHELASDVHKRISAVRATFLTQQILDLFPTECEVVWVNKNQGNNSKAAGKGKLLNRYYNVRRSLTKCGLIQRRSEKLVAEHESEDEDNQEEMDDGIQWLKENTKPWQKVQALWEATSSARIRHLQLGNQTVQEYTSQFPLLRNPRGYTLLEIDFERQYPESSLKLYREWPTFSDFVVSKLQAKDPTYVDDVSTPDIRRTKILLAINRLFPVVTSVKKKGVGQWRPSREESKESFLLHIKTFEDLQPALNMRREKMSKYGLTIQPQAVIVGHTVETIQQSYVVIDSLLYEVETPFKAIDVTFKAFHALHASYPPESQQAWMFLQLAVYNIFTKWDKQFHAVNSLLTEYRYQSLESHNDLPS